MPNVIQEYQEALNTTPELKVNVAPAFTPSTQAPIQQVPAIPVPAPPQPLQPTQPQQQPTDIPSTGEGVPPIPQVDALSFGETVSRLSAQSAQDIQKLLDTSGQPKPNEVQKQLLGNTNPVQIDPKLTSQNNPFSSGSEPRNSAERLAFEPARLANGMLNPFSDANAIAALQAGVPKGEYLSYKRALDSYNKENSPSPIFNFGLQDKANANVQRVNDSLVGLNAEQIRVKMRSVDSYGQMNSAFNRSFMPFLGEDRGSLETIFGLLSFPANLVKGVATDTVLRPAAALMSGGFNVDEFKKAYEALRPTRGGTYTGAAILGEQFSSMAVTDEKDKPFNPFAVVRDDNNILQASIGLGLDVLLDPLNLPIGKAFSRFRRSAITPPSIIPEVLSPVRQLPQSNIAGALPEARITLDIPSVVDSPIRPSPPAPNRTLVTPANRMRLPETTIAQDITISQNTVGRTVAQDSVTQVRDLTVPQKRAEPSIAASYESLARYEPSEVVFPTPRQPFTPSLDIQVKVEPSDIQLYNNVTALFNDSPQLTVIQQAVREVVEQKPITVELPKNPILQEVAEYGRTGELTPNIAVLKGATPDEVRAIVQDKLEVMRDTPLEVPRLEVQPIGVFTPTPVSKLAVQGRSMPDALLKRLESDRISIPESPNKAEALQFAEKSVRGEVPRNVKLIAENQSEVIKNITRQSGNSEEAAKLAEDYYRASKRIIDSEDTQVFVNVNQEHLPDIFRGGLKNVYESTADEFKSSKQYLRPRLSLEKTVNGIPNNPAIPAYARPTYGYIDSVNQIKTQQFTKNVNDSGHLTSRAYGDTTIQLKPSTKERSSFTVGDSLNENGGQTASVPMSSFDSASPWASAFYKEGADKVRKLPTEVSDLVQFRRYLEAQIYGGVNIDDIAALHFRQEPLPEVLAMAFEKDIKVFVNGKEIVDVKPVPISKPIVVTDSAITSVSELQKAAKGIGTLGEVSQWSVRGDFNTLLKDVLNAVEDLGLEVFYPSNLSNLVKGRVGKLSNTTVDRVSRQLNKVSLETAEDIAKSIFDALWRKSTPDQKEIVLGKISATRLEQFGLERVQTKTTPPTLPTLQHVQLFDIAQFKPLSLEQDNLLTFIANYDKQKRTGWGLVDSLKRDASVELGIPVEKIGTVLDELQVKGKVELNRSVKPNTYDLIPDRVSYESSYSEKDFEFTTSYYISNNSQVPIDDLYMTMMKQAGFSAREAKEVGRHFITEQISYTGAVSDRNLKTLISLKSLSVKSPSKQQWSSKMLQEIWEVATPQQKAYIMSNVDNLEQLGLERIARSNVIDDFLPPEGVFDIPC